MATVTAPLVLDSTLNTTDSTPVNLADVMQSGLAAIATAVGDIPNPTAANVSFDDTDAGLGVSNVQDAIDALNDGLTSVNSALTITSKTLTEISNSYWSMNASYCYAYGSIIVMNIDFIAQADMSSYTPVQVATLPESTSQKCTSFVPTRDGKVAYVYADAGSSLTINSMNNSISAGDRILFQLVYAF